MPQPVMNSGKGVVLVVGLMVRTDRCALVMPLATNDDEATPANVCQQAIEAFTADGIPLLTPLMSSDAYVSYLEAHGMDDGAYPLRVDFGATLHPGEDLGDTLPASVGGLVTFYKESGDILPGGRMAHSRMIIPGISEALIENGVPTGTYITDAQAFADKLVVSGLVSPTGIEATFYRVLHAPPGGVGAPTQVTLDRIGAYVVKGYLGSQRRRITPH